METKSNNRGPRNRQGGQRSGGGQKRSNNSNRNRNRNRNRNGGKGNRNNSNNRNRNRNRNRSPRRRPEPKPTLGQKILSFLTFGLLGKPKKKSQSARKKKSSPAAASKPKPAPKPREKKKKEPVSTPRLYVGNLSYDVVEDDLEVLFNGVGNVRSAEVVTNSRTQQSKGFAFVEMGTIEEAQRAIDVLDDEDFKGRRLNMNGAKSEGPRDGDSEESENED